MSWLYLGYKKSKDSPSPRATFPRVPSPPFARVLENRTPSNSSKSYHLLPQEKGQPLPPPSSLFENELVGAEHQENLDSEGNISNSKNTKTNVSFRPMSGLRRFDIEPGRENEYWTDNDLEGFCYRNDNFPPTPESPADYSNPLEDVLHRGVQVGVKKADDNASEQGSKMKVAMPRRDAKSRNGANSKDVEDAVACAGEHWCAFYGITYDDDNINDDGEDDSNNDGSNQKIAAEPYISLLPNVKKCKSAIVLAPPSQISLEERFLQLEKKKLEHEKQQLAHRQVFEEKLVRMIESQSVALEHQSAVLEHQSAALEHQSAALEHQSVALKNANETIKNLCAALVSALSSSITARRPTTPSGSGRRARIVGDHEHVGREGVVSGRGRGRILLDAVDGQPPKSIRIDTSFLEMIED